VIDRLRRAVRLEDLLLAAWLVLVEPLLAAPDSTAAMGPSLLEGLIGVAGLLGLAVCLGARARPEVRTVLFAGNEVAWLIGPLLGALAFVVDETTEDLGLTGVGPVLALGLIGIAVVARLRLRPLSAPERRALVTPFVIVAGGSFGEFLAGLRDLFDLSDLGALIGASGVELGLAAFVVAAVLLGILVFYVMLVFAPRQVAEREGTPGQWIARFLLFLASLIVGATWAGAIRG